jgi:hypothetical protein
MNRSDEILMRAAFAPAREMEPTAAEVSAVVRRAEQRPRSRSAVRAAWRPALVVLLALIATAYAVPATRAAIDDLVGSVADWASDGGNAASPGRPLGPDEDAAAYLRDPRYGSDPRVIAEADGYKLVVVREGDGKVGFDLGNTGVGIGALKASDFAGHAVFVLGPGAMQHADRHGHVPLFGITARSVKSVELRYASGPPQRVGGIDGGFVLLVDPRRDATEVVGLDAQGDELERAALQTHPGQKGVDIHWQDYR